MSTSELVRPAAEAGSLRVRGITATLLAAIMIGAALLRYLNLRESLWLDELHTAWVVAGSWSEIGARAQIGNQSPWYFYLVRLVVDACGMNEFSLRLPSLIAGLSLIPLAWGIAGRWGRSLAAAAMVAALVAVDRWCVYYAQEARSYALVQLVSLFQVACFARLLDRPEIRWRIGCIGLTSLMFYLHYTSVILIAGEAAAYVLVYAADRGSLSYRPLQAVIDAGLCVATAVPAVPHLVYIAQHRGNWAQMVARPGFAGLFILFPVAAYSIPTLAALVLDRVGGKASGGSAGNGSAKRRDFTHAVILCLCWLAVPLSATWMLTRLDVARLFMVRYLVGIVVAPMMLGGVLLAAVRSRTIRIAAALIVLVLAVYQGGALSKLAQSGLSQSERNQDWRGAVAEIQRDSTSLDWPVLVRSGFMEADELRQSEDPLLQSYCLAPVTSLYRLDSPGRTLIPLPVTDAGRLTRQSRETLRHSRGVWVLIYGAARSRASIERDLRASLQQVELRAVRIRLATYGNIMLLKLRFEPDKQE
jgi:uncharacterized membrane protein